MRNHHGWCEPEGWIELADEVILFECKLTGNEHGRIQMEWTYKPLLEKLLGKPVRCLMICRWVRTDTPGPFVEGPEAFAISELPFATWHVLL